MWITIILCAIIVLALLSLGVTVYKSVAATKAVIPARGAVTPATQPVVVVVRRRWFFITYPWWTVGIFVVLWLALTNFAVTKAILWGIATKPINGVRYGSRENPTIVNTLPQGKSVGGPLRWNEGANVTLRPRMNRETLDENGICFAGVIPPASWMDVEFIAYHESTSPWKAVLIDHGYVGRFLSPSLMQQHAVAKTDVPSGVLDLFDLPTKGKHAARITDYSVSASEVSRGFKVSELYVQISSGGPKEVVIDILEEPKDTFQCLAEVGTNETSFNIPQQNWKWLWIVPIHHEAYEASLDGISVPAEGITTDKYSNHLGIEISVNGKKNVLSKALLLQPTDCTSSTIALSLNTNGVLTPEGSVKPARIIVGIQL